MAISSSASASILQVCSALTPHSSLRSSSHSCVSSTSWIAPPNLETNSASDRARDASRMCAATEVPDRSIWRPQTRTSSRSFCSATKRWITAAANRLVLARNSSGSLPFRCINSPLLRISTLCFQLSAFPRSPLHFNFQLSTFSFSSTASPPRPRHRRCCRFSRP